MRRQVATVGFLLAFLPLACGDPADEATGSPKEPSDNGPQVLMIAIDGLEPSLLLDMLAHRELPNFANLMKNGSFATIEAVVGTTSPVVWTTVASGTAPEEHGITGFTVDEEPVTSSLRRRPAFWNILPHYGVELATVGWMVTWPAEEKAGIMISDRTHWGRFHSKVAPPDIVDVERYIERIRRLDSQRIARQFTSYPYDPGYKAWPSDDPRYAVNFLLERRLISIFRRDTFYSQIAKELLHAGDLDALAVYYQGIDYVSHGFWQWFEPEPYRQEGWQIEPTEIEQLSTIIPKYYKYVDRLLGELLSEVGPETLTLVLSDHGFGTGLGRYRIESGDFISGNHREQAALILSGKSVIKGLPQLGKITHFDILPSLLYYVDLPLARDFHGNALLRYFTDTTISHRELTLVDTYREDGRLATAAPTESVHDEAILDELRSLGYIQ